MLVKNPANKSTYSCSKKQYLSSTCCHVRTVEQYVYLHKNNKTKLIPSIQRTNWKTQWNRAQQYFSKEFPDFKKHNNISYIYFIHGAFFHFPEYKQKTSFSRHVPQLITSLKQKILKKIVLGEKQWHVRFFCWQLLLWRVFLGEFCAFVDIFSCFCWTNRKMYFSRMKVFI